MTRFLTRKVGLFAAGVLVLAACSHSTGVSSPMPIVPEGTCITETDVGGSSYPPADAPPIVRVPPQYPKQAFDRGVQGWVCIGFTVATDGTVNGPVVVASAPEGYFEEPGLTAVRQWRYSPFRQGGESIERPGMRVMLKFAMASD